MKRTKIVSSLLLIVLLFSIFIVAPTADAVNLINNGGFEGFISTSVPADWSITKDAGMVLAEKENCADGSMALCMTAEATQTSPMRLSQTVDNLQADTLYQLSVKFCLSAALSGNFGFDTEITDGAGGTLCSLSGPVSHSDGAWMEISCLFFAPSNGMADVTLSFLPDGQGEKSLLLDNVRVEKAKIGKMSLHKSPVGYVLPGVVTTEADAEENLPEFYDGTVSLSGGKAVENQTDMLVRYIKPDEENVLAMLAFYRNGGMELTSIESFPKTEDSILVKRFLWYEQMKGFVWEVPGLVPLFSGELRYDVDVETPIIKNGDFESYIGSTVQFWDAYGVVGGNDVTWQTTETGNKRMLVSKNEEKLPYAQQKKVQVYSDATYKFSLSCVQEDVTEDAAAVILYFYDKDGVCIADLVHKLSRDTENHSFELETPSGTASVDILLSMYGTGKAYFDDLKMQCLTIPDVGSVQTDEIFYYPEWKQGTVSLMANTVYYPEIENGKVNFFLKEGSVILEKLENVSIAEDTASWTFSIEKMKKVGNPYTVEAVLRSASGKEIGTCQTTVYQYPRPTALDENGNYYDEKGKLFVPHIMAGVLDYGVNGILDKGDTDAILKGYDDLKKAGYNVVTLSVGAIFYPDLARETLDELHRRGMKGIVQLYQGNIPPSRPEREKLAKTLIETVKDHKALYAYNVMDEPSIGKNGLTEQDLIDTYRLIRDIDKHHPTYVVVAPSKYETFYNDEQRANMVSQKLTKYTDVLCYDPYVGCWDDVVSTYVYEISKAAKEFAYHNRPCYTYLQLFDWRDYLVTADEYRHMWYQGMLGGSKGMGGYSFNTTTEGPIPLHARPVWEDMTAFGQEELAVADEYFYSGKYPVFNEIKTKDYLYRSYVDGNDLYAVVLRLDETRATSREEQPAVDVSIPLVSADGSTAIGAHKATLLYGGDAETKVGNGTLDISLAWRKALVYKIEPQ